MAFATPEGGNALEEILWLNEDCFAQMLDLKRLIVEVTISIPMDKLFLHITLNQSAINECIAVIVFQYINLSHNSFILRG